ncbi:hypothetical protein GCM10027290_22200 [Micromonospora sonneratiae]
MLAPAPRAGVTTTAAGVRGSRHGSRDPSDHQGEGTGAPEPGDPTGAPPDGTADIGGYAEAGGPSGWRQFQPSVTFSASQSVPENKRPVAAGGECHQRLGRPDFRIQDYTDDGKSFSGCPRVRLTPT